MTEAWITLPLEEFEALMQQVRELEAEIQRLKEELDTMARKEKDEIERNTTES